MREYSVLPASTLGPDGNIPFTIRVEHNTSSPCATTLEIESDAAVGENGSGLLFVDIEWS